MKWVRFCRFILAHPAVRPGTQRTFETLQMENGMPIGGVDFTGRETIVSAALAGLISRSHLNLLHGHRQITLNCEKARYLRRVGLTIPLKESVQLAGVDVLSFPERARIGTVRHSIDSPLLQQKIAIA